MAGWRPWERTERIDVRAFVEHLREVPNPQRLRRRPDGPAAVSVNPRTGKLNQLDRRVGQSGVVSDPVAVVEIEVDAEHAPTARPTARVPPRHVRNNPVPAGFTPDSTDLDAEPVLTGDPCW